MEELHAEVETLDQVPEPVRALYEQRDGAGAYRLKVRGVEFPEDVEGLRSALRKERERNKQLSDQLRAIPRDFDGDLWKQLLELRDRVEAGAGADAPKVSGEHPAERFESVRKRMEERFGAEVKDRETKIDQLSGFVRGLLVDSALQDAISQIGVLPQYREAVRALLERRRRPEVVEDEGMVFRAVVRTDMGEASIAEWVGEWARTEEAQAYLPATNRTGAGSPPDAAASGGRVNPWHPSSLNLTEQGRILRDSPEIARRLRAAAGVY